MNCKIVTLLIYRNIRNQQKPACVIHVVTIHIVEAWRVEKLFNCFNRTQSTPGTT